MVIGNAVPGRQGLQIRVVGDHRHHVHGQLADALAIEQVVEAVVGLGDHDGDLGAIAGRGQLEGHVEGREAQVQADAEQALVEIAGHLEFHPDEEALGFAVIEAVVLGDIAALLEQIARDHVHGAEATRALGGENPGIGRAAHDEVLCMEMKPESQNPTCASRRSGSLERG